MAAPIVVACAPRVGVLAQAPTTYMDSAKVGGGVWREFFVGTGYAQGIARGNGGDFWVAGGEHSTSIAHVSPGGKVTPVNVGTMPLELTQDSTGNLWITTTPNDNEVLYLKPHTFEVKSFTMADYQNGGIVADTHGSAWIVQNSHIGHLRPNGKFTEYAVTAQADSGIVAERGLLWFRGENYLSSLDPHTGRVQTYAAPVGCCGGGIVVARDGSFWYFARNDENDVMNFNPTTQVTQTYRAPANYRPYGAPNDTAIGPDGTIWYCVQRLHGRQFNKHVVGGGFARFDPQTQRFTTYAAPADYDWNWDMVAAPNGTMWSTAGTFVVELDPSNI